MPKQHIETYQGDRFERPLPEQIEFLDGAFNVLEGVLKGVLDGRPVLGGLLKDVDLLKSEAFKAMREKGSEYGKAIH